MRQKQHEHSIKKTVDKKLRGMRGVMKTSCKQRIVKSTVRKWFKRNCYYALKPRYTAACSLLIQNLQQVFSLCYKLYIKIWTKWQCVKKIKDVTMKIKERVESVLTCKTVRAEEKNIKQNNVGLMFSKPNCQLNFFAITRRFIVISPSTSGKC